MSGCIPTGVAMLAVVGALPVGAVAGALLATVLGRPAEPSLVRPRARPGRHRT